jgi:hypothetical protein
MQDLHDNASPSKRMSPNSPESDSATKGKVTIRPRIPQVKLKRFDTNKASSFDKEESVEVILCIYQ